ncbi:hypothetical protein WBP07_12430 [Novosphingobium sp. BL-8A]
MNRKCHACQQKGSRGARRELGQLDPPGFVYLMRVYGISCGGPVAEVWAPWERKIVIEQDVAACNSLNILANGYRALFIGKIAQVMMKVMGRYARRQSHFGSVGDAADPASAHGKI